MTDPIRDAARAAEDAVDDAADAASDAASGAADAVGDAADDTAAGAGSAIDRTAGRVMQRTTLATLFERAPHLAPQREPIERFYAQSAARFFTGAPAADGDPLSLRELCTELRRFEKRRET